MKLLGIDYGDKKIGLAKSAGKTAVPLLILKNENDDDLLKKMREVCHQEDIEKIVIGVPVGNQKTATDQELKTQAFVKFIKEKFDIPVDTIDERMTSRMAERFGRGMVEGSNDDAFAAMLILQNYIDKKNV